MVLHLSTKLQVENVPLITTLQAWLQIIFLANLVVHPFRLKKQKLEIGILWDTLSNHLLRLHFSWNHNIYFSTQNWKIFWLLQTTLFSTVQNVSTFKFLGKLKNFPHWIGTKTILSLEQTYLIVVLSLVCGTVLVVQVRLTGNTLFLSKNASSTHQHINTAQPVTLLFVLEFYSYQWMAWLILLF